MNPVTCIQCNGSGSDCQTCEGEGRIETGRGIYLGHGAFRDEWHMEDCPECGGRPECPICRGSGRLEEAA